MEIAAIQTRAKHQVQEEKPPVSGGDPAR